MSDSHENVCDFSPDDTTKQNIHKVRDAVKNIQSNINLPISPLPKPRRISPAPSPTLPRKHPSPVPSERIKLQGVRVTPPDSPMRRRSDNFKPPLGDIRPKPPVRKRKNKFFKKGEENKEGTNLNSGEVGINRNSIGDFVDLGAPNVANVTTDEQEGQILGQTTEEHRDKGERVCSGADNKTENNDVVKLKDDISNTASAEGGEVGGESQQRDRFESFVMVGGGDDVSGGRVSNLTSPDVMSLTEEDLVSCEGEGGSENELPTSSSNPSVCSPEHDTPLTSDVIISPMGAESPIDTTVTTDTSEVGGVTTPIINGQQHHLRNGQLPSSTPLVQTGKKKPPPLPTPYHARPPPVPTKTRSLRKHFSEPSSIMTTVAEDNGPVAKANDVTVTMATIPTSITTAPSPTDPESGLERRLSSGAGGKNNNLQPPKRPPRPPSPQRKPSTPTANTDQRQALSPTPIIYEEPESPGDSSGGSGGPLTPMNSVELRVLTSRPDTMPKHLSYGSSDSLELSGGNSPNNRHSTIGLARLKAKNRSLPSGRPHLKGTRPLSDASLNLLDGYDVVLPAGHLQDVMKSVISNDEKMQEATIYEVVQACMKAMPHVTSTRELPPHIPEMPTDTRSKVIHELYTTEYTYVNSLETLSEVFKDPLASVLGDESGRIFANVDDILAFNKGFLALLHSRLLSWKPDSYLGDLFIGMFTQSHRSMYAIYCSNYDSADLLLQQKRKKKEFELQLSICFQNPRVMPGLTLAAYLITPVQRVPRYILLLKDIIQRTADDHPDYSNLLTAREVMGELAGYIDAQIRESQTKRTFDTLKYKVVGLADLDSPDRSLVREGQCFLKNIKKLYQCILFNDQLVFALGDSRQSRVQLQLPLEGVWVEDLEDLDPQTSNQDAIEVYTPDRPYTIYTQTSTEKKLWLAKLRETIYQLLLKDGKCTRSSVLGTMQRNATFVYADGRLYTGNLTCARRQGKGTMVWPDNSKYIGDWVDDERHGEGQFTFNTREVYDGKWVEDKINGYGKITFASDDKYIGYWKDGMRHGKGKIIYSNGDFFEGYFVNGQIEGEGTLRCRNGLEYKGSWKHSQRHGQGRLRTVLCNTYEGEFSRNQIHGAGRMVYKSGDSYEGHWKTGMRQGHGKYTSKREGVYDGTWFNDLRHGKGRQQYPNKDVYDGSWELNLRHGKGILEFSTYDRYAGDFSYDMISGEGEMVYTDDCRYNGQWMNGLYHGQGIMVYHESAPMKSTFNGDWRHGLRHGQGELVMFDGSVYRGLWVNDKPHGKGNYSVPTANYYYSGDWVEGKREGKGEENSQLGLYYKGQWKGDQKWGSAEEKTLVGTTFTGHWEKDKKHGRGIRKTVTGIVEEQVWRLGMQTNDPLRKTAIELPQLSRLDY